MLAFPEAHFANQSIGTLPIGSQGNSGIYTGYTLVGGDDFNGSLNVVNPAAPLNRYFTTHVYGNGARSVSGLLARSYDMDPYHTGSQDSNRGVAVGSTNMAQSASVLSIQARAANGGETAYVNTRTIVAGMIHTGGYLTAGAPCIIEAYVKIPSGAPTGWHPTFWVANASPLSQSGGNGGAIEFDFPECSSIQLEANVNIHGTVSGWSGSSTSLSTGNFDAYHLYSLVLTASSALFYIDGVLKKTVSADTTVVTKPFYLLITNHTFDGSYGGDANVDLSAWAAAGANGPTISVDYYRIWIPTSVSSQVIRPTQALQTLQVAYNTSMTYTFPSAATLWGAGVTDYCQAIKFEDNEPGCHSEGANSYDQFPGGLSFNSGTRVLTGVTTDKGPGRLHVSATPFLSGGCLSYVARGYIDVGPHITMATQNIINGVVYSFDLYAGCDCGTLLPKVVTCTGLPTGLSFSSGTGLITGTPTVNGSTTATVGVTNSSGQTDSLSVSFVVTAALAISIDGAGVTENNSSSPQTLTVSTTNANDIVLVFVQNKGTTTSGTVSAMTSSHLTFTKLQGLAFGTISYDMEVWYAKAATAVTSEVISISFNASTPAIAARVSAIGITGIDQTTTIDTNAGSIITTTANSGSTPSVNISTDHGNDIIIGMLVDGGVGTSLGTVTRPSGFTQLLTTSGSSDVSYKIVAATQSAATLSWSFSGGSHGYGLIVFALKGVT